jgi:hypothetical protein
LVAQARQNPALHHQDAALHLRLVAGLAHAGRQDGKLVVLGEILIRPVDIRIVAMSLGHTALEIIRIMCPSPLCGGYGLLA